MMSNSIKAFLINLHLLVSSFKSTPAIASSLSSSYINSDTQSFWNVPKASITVLRVHQGKERPLNMLF